MWILQLTHLLKMSLRNNHMRIRLNQREFLSSLTYLQMSSRNNHMRIRVNQREFYSSLTYRWVRQITGWNSWLHKPTDHFRGTYEVSEENNPGWVARYAWVCVCILDGGHFSFPDADPRNDWACSKVHQCKMENKKTNLIAAAYIPNDWML